MLWGGPRPHPRRPRPRGAAGRGSHAPPQPDRDDRRPSFRHRDSRAVACNRRTRGCRYSPGEKENIVGVIHAKDLLRAMYAAGGGRDDEEAFATFDVLERGDEALFRARNPPRSTEQMRQFLRRHTHFALSGRRIRLARRPDHGSRDILEEIVGESPTSLTPAEEKPVHRTKAATCWCDGAMTIRDITPGDGLRCRTRRPHRGRAGHPRGADDSDEGPGVLVPRLPLRDPRAGRTTGSPA